MRLYELIEALQELADTCGGDEVLVATQPRYPLAYTLRGVRLVEPELPEGPCPDHDREDCILCLAHQPGAAPSLWLVLGDQADDPYAVPEEVWS